MKAERFPLADGAGRGPPLQTRLWPGEILQTLKIVQVRDVSTAETVIQLFSFTGIKLKKNKSVASRFLEALIKTLWQSITCKLAANYLWFPSFRALFSLWLKTRRNSAVQVGSSAVSFFAFISILFWGCCFFVFFLISALAIMSCCSPAKGSLPPSLLFPPSRKPRIYNGVAEEGLIKIMSCYCKQSPTRFENRGCMKSRPSKLAKGGMLCLLLVKRR